METVSVNIPATLYVALYQRAGMNTSAHIVSILERAVSGDARRSVAAREPYPRPAPGTITGKIWGIADRIEAERGAADRESVIKACMDAGINVNTASTQFSHWKKAKKFLP